MVGILGMARVYPPVEFVIYKDRNPNDGHYGHIFRPHSLIRILTKRVQRTFRVVVVLVGPATEFGVSMDTRAQTIASCCQPRFGQRTIRCNSLESFEILDRQTNNTIIIESSRSIERVWSSFSWRQARLHPGDLPLLLFVLELPQFPEQIQTLIVSATSLYGEASSGIPAAISTRPSVPISANTVQDQSCT